MRGRLDDIERTYEYLCNMTSYDVWNKVRVEATSIQAYLSLRDEVWVAIMFDPDLREEPSWSNLRPVHKRVRGSFERYWPSRH